MKKTVFAALIAVGMGVSIAAYAAASAYTTNWGTITRIESFGDDFHVYGLDLAPNPNACSSVSLAKVDYRLSETKKEGLARVLTSAFLAGREVKVKLQGTYCEGSYPAIYGVQVK